MKAHVLYPTVLCNKLRIVVVCNCFVYICGENVICNNALLISDWEQEKGGTGEICI